MPVVTRRQSFLVNKGKNGSEEVNIKIERERKIRPVNIGKGEEEDSEGVAKHTHTDIATENLRGHHSKGDSRDTITNSEARKARTQSMEMIDIFQALHYSEPLTAEEDEALNRSVDDAQGKPSDLYITTSI
jgi:hypothetical protein